jgi:hypothetical protein
LRIDLAKLTVTSNLGVSEAQFDSQGKKGRDIIGGNEVAFESLEIYEM